MRLHCKLFLILFLLASVAVWAQERPRSEDPDQLARLSYQRSSMSDHGFERICIAVSQTGNYRMVLRRNETIGFEGKMAPDHLEQLKKLLTAELRSSSGNDAGIIRDHSESFMAEISRIEFPPAFQQPSRTPSELLLSDPGTPHRVRWLNADDQAPFPVPMAKVVEWMKTFHPKDAKMLDDLAFSEVCPSTGLRLVQPSVAANEHH